MSKYQRRINDYDKAKEKLGYLLVLEKKKCEASFHYFVRRAWANVLECNTKFEDNWHIRYICWVLQKEIERIAEGRPKTADIIINVPPRSMKTTVATKCLNAWTWIRYPWLKFFTISYNDVLAQDGGVATRNIIRSAWYGQNWGDLYKMMPDQDTKTHYINDKGGERIAASMTGTILGRGANIIILDDPADPEEADSEVYRENTIRIFKNTIFSRLNNANVDIRVIIQQRLHENDLTGSELTESPGDYHHICLPAKLSDNVRPKYLAEMYDSENYLFKNRFSKKMLDSMKAKLGSYAFSGQYMQSPSPDEGGMFKRKNFVYWKHAGDNLEPVRTRIDGKLTDCRMVEIPDTFDEIIIVVDSSFKDLESSDPVAIGLLGRKGPDKYLLALINERLGFSKTVEAIKQMKETSGFVTAILIEEASNGVAVIATLKNEIPGVVAVSPHGDSKESRATPMSRQHEAGNIIVPHPKMYSWADTVVGQMANFPRGKHDDIVDAMSHGVNYLSDPNHQVIGAYRWNDPQHRKDFNLREQTRYSQYAINFAAVTQQEDFAVAHVFAAWNPVEGHLWIYNELLMQNAIPAIAVTECRMILTENASGNDHFLGGAELFSEDPMIKTVAKQYRKLGIHLKQPKRFDENGSVAVLMQMFSSGRITLHKRCVKTDQQLREWIISNGKPTKKETGLARCLCMIASELDRKFNLFVAPQQSPVRGYKREQDAGVVNAVVGVNANKWQAA